MVDLSPVLQQFLVLVLCFLGLATLLCLLRVVRGPRFTDRLVALNAICTLVILMICLLSFLLGEAYLVDVAILYALLNLLAIIILSRVTIARHRNRKEGKR